jgi:hypothetical protein
VDRLVSCWIWLRLGRSRASRRSLGGKVALGCSWEVLVLDARLCARLRYWNLLSRLSNQLRSLVRIVASVGLDSLESLPSVLACESLDLLGLLANDLAGVLDLGIDELLVHDIDKWSEVDDTGGKKSHAPHGKKLDQVVGEEGCSEGLRMSVGVR